MYELSTENTKLIAGGKLVYVTPEWKHEEAVISGKIFGSLGVFMGSLTFLAEMSCATFTLPFALGAAMYGMGYGLGKLENCSLKDYTWYDIRYY